jgi:hypothetical protein
MMSQSHRTDDRSPALLPPPDVARASRGRYLRRHRARVIEQDDLLVVEFVDRTPWYTRAVAEAETERRASRTFSLALMGAGVTTSALTLLHLFRWI